MIWQQEKKRLAGKLFSLKPFGNANAMHNIWGVDQSLMIFWPEEISVADNWKVLCIHPGQTDDLQDPGFWQDFVLHFHILELKALFPHRKHDGTRGFKAFGDPIIADHFCDWKSRILWMSSLSACFPPQVVSCLLKLIPGQEDKTISFGRDTVVHLALFYAFEKY